MPEGNIQLNVIAVNGSQPFIAVSYTHLAVFTVPANLPVEKRKEIQETAKAIYKLLGCKDLSRVDMFLQEDGTIVLNEVNTMPGFTSYSRYPRMMLATGMTVTELIDHCIEMALQQ